MVAGGCFPFRALVVGMQVRGDAVSGGNGAAQWVVRAQSVLGYSAVTDGYGTPAYQGIPRLQGRWV